MLDKLKALRAVAAAGAWAALALVVALALGAPAFAVTAPEVARSERAEVRLHADHITLAPGGAATLILDLRLAPGWHSYWRNPGDSGMATVIRWSAPEGVEIGDIIWPAPHRLPLGDLVNYGFEGQALLRAELRAPEDWPAGEPILLRAEASWLVCKDICVPEQGAFTLELPTGDHALTDLQVSRLAATARSAEPAALKGAAFEVDGDRLRVAAVAPAFGMGRVVDAYFYAAPLDLVAASAPQRFGVENGRVTIDALRDDGAAPQTLDGVLAVTLVDAEGAETRVAYAVSAQPGPVPPIASPILAALGAVGLAFVGGLILNVMPCVFPVLSLKALAFARQGEAMAAERLRDGLAYGAGVLLSFVAFAVALLSFREAGAAVGWGFQLQSPLVVALLAAALFLVGLNLSGVFSVDFGAGGARAQTLAAQGGPIGSFFTGVLAALVASPCTAPFMGAALGYALTQSAPVALAVFVALGLGFAAPIVALSASPALGRLLPQPGAWTVRFKELMAFPMYLAAAWLLWVLGGQAGVDAMFAALAGLVLLALAVWAWAQLGPSVARLSRIAFTALAAVALVGSAATLSTATAPRAAAVEPVVYSPAALASLREEGRGVFVNVTADWCVNCQVNDRLVLATDAFAEALGAAQGVYMKADWTRPDADIAAFLRSHGVQSIPLYVYYPPGGAAPQILPTLLTVDAVREALSG